MKCYREGCPKEVWSLSACEEHVKKEWKGIEKKTATRIFNGMRAYISKEDPKDREKLMEILQKYYKKLEEE